VLNAAGDIIARDKLANTPEVRAAFSARYPRATIVMETGSHSPWVSRLFEGRGYRVYVANARKVRAIANTSAGAIQLKTGHRLAG
jgi:transposase